MKSSPINFGKNSAEHLLARYTRESLARVVLGFAQDPAFKLARASALRLAADFTSAYAAKHPHAVGTVPGGETVRTCVLILGKCRLPNKHVSVYNHEGHISPCYIGYNGWGCPRPD